MGAIKFANRAAAPLNAGIASGATTLVLTAGSGAKFPALGAGESFGAVIQKGILDTDAREYITVTARSGDTLTVTRAQEGSTAQAFAAGDIVARVVLAGELDSFVQKAGDTMTGDLLLSSPPASSDNSNKAISSIWAKLGFAFSFGTTNYVKFPDWLGGVIFQWGNQGSGASGSAVTFPLVFPVGIGAAYVTPQVAGANFATYQSPSASNMFIQGWNTAGSQVNIAISWLAIGR